MILKVSAALCCMLAVSYAAIAPGQNAYLPPKEPGYNYNKPQVPFPSGPPRQPPFRPPQQQPYRPPQEPFRPVQPQRPSYPSPPPQQPLRPIPQPPRPQLPPQRPALPVQPRPPAATIPAPYQPVRPTPNQPARPTGPGYIPPAQPQRPSGPGYIPPAQPQRPSFPPQRPSLPTPPPYRPTPARPTPGYIPPQRPAGPPSPTYGPGPARPTPQRPTPPFQGQPSQVDQKFVGENDHLLVPHKPAEPFDFKYAVKDAEGNDYSHNAINNGDRTDGEYRVLLPDGRTQVVKYVADWATGFHAKISYEGNPTYPSQGQNKFPSQGPGPAPGGYPSGRPNVPFQPSGPSQTNQINQQYTPAGGYKY
ncbi:unnamed protein product [Brassicogethes aeneus]|uniref:Uncharacterized protein n=1 Tax=Brassicogethes aeneus TaxID=1431903 RepID=A0A9P0AT39_BRAAE|nr:unnamed protein product [Brassicogethes aeneus]